ncbi:MAG: indole-3-glycerol phosphate synthase TrpC [Deltaproteobacteria bacterium]|nr:indole-3-glycerol phosphate synthase TrpC [Deltaproteobacteria bacterium]
MILQQILTTKAAEVAALRQHPAGPAPEPRVPPYRLRQALRPGAAPGTRIIAEIKHASPSAGLLREPFDPAALARDLEAAGAAALSVLTDETYFRGGLSDLVRARAASALPLLRKDFIVDELQVREGAAHGADAVLLIARALSPARLRALLQAAEGLGLDALVEVHDETELGAALEAGATLLGINNRDLDTFSTDLGVTRRLLKRVPAGVVVVSESGIQSRQQIVALEAEGVHAFLIGETLMRAPEPSARLRALLGRER